MGVAARVGWQPEAGHLDCQPECLAVAKLYIHRYRRSVLVSQLEPQQSQAGGHTECHTWWEWSWGQQPECILAKKQKKCQVGGGLWIWHKVVKTIWSIELSSVYRPLPVYFTHLQSRPFQEIKRVVYFLKEIISHSFIQHGILQVLRNF